MWGNLSGRKGLISVYSPPSHSAGEKCSFFITTATAPPTGGQQNRHSTATVVGTGLQLQLSRVLLFRRGAIVSMPDVHLFLFFTLFSLKVK